MMFPDYRSFLRIFLEKGYAIEPLVAENLLPESKLYLRHDIDFDCKLALQMAKIEASMGVKATYFFMIASDSYNLLSTANAACVEEIIDLGHKVSLHFDPLCYSDCLEGLTKETRLFKYWFDLDVDLISLHRPNPFFLSHDQKIGEVAHTYQSKYLKEINYFSDSRGSFRFGAPEKSESFSACESIHLLIHPIWWMIAEQTPQETLDAFIERRVDLFQNHIEANCLSYSRNALRRFMEE
ncbi:hypothetical protein [Kordiimonas lacus]|uniref:Polysaccharide deacetylase n=1 Tax=Kordiimonas lacus TaxID=637679 RepID=A0A1G6TBP8_9PROT|nr:hypothetical protein [Kordiimonas lacus]SDD26284.1 hypothetical protein SAMN04488071_0180 [Kordiimonas lacus]